MTKASRRLPRGIHTAEKGRFHLRIPRVLQEGVVVKVMFCDNRSEAVGFCLLFRPSFTVRDFIPPIICLSGFGPSVCRSYDGALSDASGGSSVEL